MSEHHHELIYGIDDIPPPGQTAVLGFQHYLTMFGSTVAIPFLLAPALGITDPVELSWIIGTMFFVSGIATLLQSTYGNRLPIIQGGTFSFLAPTFAICGMAALASEGWQVRMQHVQGAIILGALVEIVIGFSGLIGKLIRFVGPITIAPTIALIGLSLFEFGAPMAGMDWIVGGLTITLIIVFSQYLRKTHRTFEMFPILLAIVLAWLVAVILTSAGVFAPATTDAATTAAAITPGVTVEAVYGFAAHPSYVSFDAVSNADWFRIPYPFQWGMPQFGLAAFVGMLAGYLASMVESIGDYYACARLSGAPTPDGKTINKGIAFEGIGCLVAGVIGSGNGTTSYSENIGAIGLTRVGSRRVVQVGALIMLILGMVGKFGAIFATIPGTIVGGMYCAMFGMIAAVGLSNLQFINLNSARNLFILGFSFFMGLSVPTYFKSTAVVIDAAPWLASIINTLGSTGMAVGATFALFLDNTIPGTDEERGLTAWSQPHEAPHVLDDDEDEEEDNATPG